MSQSEPSCVLEAGDVSENARPELAVHKRNLLLAAAVVASNASRRRLCSTALCGRVYSQTRPGLHGSTESFAFMQDKPYEEIFAATQLSCHWQDCSQTCPSTPPALSLEAFW